MVPSRTLRVAALVFGSVAAIRASTSSSLGCRVRCCRSPRRPMVRAVLPPASMKLLLDLNHWDHDQLARGAGNVGPAAM